MSIQVHHQPGDDGVARFELVGVVSRDYSTLIQDPLVGVAGLDVYSRPVLLDLSKVAHIESTGFEWLLTCHARCQERGGELVLHSLTHITSDLMNIMRLNLVLQVAENERQATEKVRNGNVNVNVNGNGNGTASHD